MSQGYAAGGICSSVGDLLRWQHVLHHGELLNRTTYEQMITGAGGRTYGLGIAGGSNNGHRVYFHAGAIYGFEAMITDYPDDDVAIAVVANSRGEVTSDIEARIARILFGISDPVERPLPAEQRQQFVGTYRARGFEVSVVARNGDLLLESEGDPPSFLSYLGEETFAESDSPDLVTIHDSKLRVTHYGALRFEATRVP
jgi:hypothetical protein